MHVATCGFFCFTPPPLIALEVSIWNTGIRRPNGAQTVHTEKLSGVKANNFQQNYQELPHVHMCSSSQWNRSAVGVNQSPELQGDPLKYAILMCRSHRATFSTRLGHNRPISILIHLVTLNKKLRLICQFAVVQKTSKTKHTNRQHTNIQSDALVRKSKLNLITGSHLGEGI